MMFAHRPGKKRYWRPEFDLPEAQRYWLKARPDGVDDGLNLALAEELFGLTHHDLSFPVFPDGSGFWCSYNPQASQFSTARPPPF